VGHHGAHLRAAVHEAGDRAGRAVSRLPGERLATQRHQSLAAPFGPRHWVRAGVREESRRGDGRGAHAAVSGDNVRRLSSDILRLVLARASFRAGLTAPALSVGRREPDHSDRGTVIMEPETQATGPRELLEFMFRLGQAYLASGEQTALVEFYLGRVAAV